MVPSLPVRTLKTSEAASYLNVSPNTLRAWERRFGYPTPMRTEGKHRLYTHGEIAALRDALKEGLSISSAISRAREKLTGDTPVLVGALTACELDRADAAMEAALALRAVERAVEEVASGAGEGRGERAGVRDREQGETDEQAEEEEPAVSPGQRQTREAETPDEAGRDDEQWLVGDRPAGGPPRPAQDDDVTEPIGRPLDDVEQADGLGDDGGVLDPAEEGR